MTKYWHKTTKVNHQPCFTMHHPWGATLHMFHSIIIHRNALLFSQDGSWHLTNLLYHVFRVNSHFHLDIKIKLLQLKNTHISDILVAMHAFPGTPPHADVTASFWSMRVITLDIQKYQELCFLHITVRFHTYFLIFRHDKTLLIFTPSLTHPH